MLTIDEINDRIKAVENIRDNFQKRIIIICNIKFIIIKIGKLFRNWKEKSK